MTGDHLKMVAIFVIGVLTVVGVVIIASVEAKRADKGKSSLLSRQKPQAKQGD